MLKQFYLYLSLRPRKKNQFLKNASAAGGGGRSSFLAKPARGWKNCTWPVLALNIGEHVQSLIGWKDNTIVCEKGAIRS